MDCSYDNACIVYCYAILMNKEAYIDKISISSLQDWGYLNI